MNSRVILATESFTEEFRAGSRRWYPVFMLLSSNGAGIECVGVAMSSSTMYEGGPLLETLVWPLIEIYSSFPLKFWLLAPAEMTSLTYAHHTPSS